MKSSAVYLKAADDMLKDGDVACAAACYVCPLVSRNELPKDYEARVALVELFGNGVDYFDCIDDAGNPELGILSLCLAAAISASEGD